MNGAFDLAKVRVAVSNTVVRSTETPDSSGVSLVHGTSCPSALY